MSTITRIALPLLALAACTVPEKLSPDEVIDPDAPQTFLTQVPPEFAPRASELRFEADREATFECSVDGADPEPCVSPLPLVLDDGPHHVAVTAIAGAHRDRTPATAAWTVDSVAPRTYFTLSPAGAVADTVARFAFASEEADVTFECRRDGVEDFPCTSPLELTVSEGLHSLRVTAIDRAGQRDPSPPLCTWTADVTRPLVTFRSGPSGPTRSTAATFELEASEPNLTFSCRLDGGAAATCTNPVTFSWVAEGAHALAVTAVDAAGNSTAAPVVRTWSADTIAPETGFVSPPIATFGPTASFTLWSNESGVTYECSLDGVQPVPCAADHTISVQPGTHTYTAWARDAAGNTDGDGVSHTWLVN